MMSSMLALFGCGGKTGADFKVLLEKARNDLQAKTASHQSVWDFGKAACWDLTHDGVLIFNFPDKKVTCEAQIMGSFDKSQGTWLWAWGDPDMPNKLAVPSIQLRK